MQNLHFFLNLCNVLFKHTNCNNVYFLLSFFVQYMHYSTWGTQNPVFFHQLTFKWRCVTWRTRGGGEMHALHVLMNRHRGSLLCFLVIKHVYLQIINRSLIGVDFAVVELIATITRQLYQALTRAMRIIPWFWATTPLRGSWKITSLQSALVQTSTSAARTRCPRIFFGPPEIYIPQHP